MLCPFQWPSHWLAKPLLHSRSLNALIGHCQAGAFMLEMDTSEDHERSQAYAPKQGGSASRLHVNVYLLLAAGWRGETAFLPLNHVFFLNDAIWTSRKSSQGKLRLKPTLSSLSHKVSLLPLGTGRAGVRSLIKSNLDVPSFVGF